MGTIFIWANILSTNLLRAIEKAIQKQDPKGTPFYFAGLLLDVLCASNPFPRLKCAWTPKCPPIHIYCKELWTENSYKEMYIIYDHLIAPVHKLFFEADMPRISKQAKNPYLKLETGTSKNTLLTFGLQES